VQMMFDIYVRFYLLFIKIIKNHELLDTAKIQNTECVFLDDMYGKCPMPYVTEMSCMTSKIRFKEVGGEPTTYNQFCLHCVVLLSLRVEKGDKNCVHYNLIPIFQFTRIMYLILVGNPTWHLFD